MPFPALEAHLRADPDDGSAWLVYGDWLSDRDDARGALIALERREAANLLSSGEAEALRSLRVELAAQRGAWTREGLDVAWRHGFPSEVRLTWDDDASTMLAELLAHPDAVLLRTVRLRAPRPADDGDEYDPDREPVLHPLGELASLPLDPLRELDLGYSPIGNPGVTELVASPRLAGLDTLDLRYTSVGDEGACALAASPHLAGLRSLSLQGNRIGPDGASALAASPHLGLARLDLRLNGIGEPGARALAASPRAAGLRTLSLYRDDIGPDGARALAESPHLPLPLRRLWMSG